MIEESEKLGYALVLKAFSKKKKKRKLTKLNKRACQ